MMINDEQLYELLAQEKIAYSYHEHLPVDTVEQAQKICTGLIGFHVKNLFLRDKKRNFKLFTIKEDCAIDLKKLSKQVNAQGNFSFSSPEDLMFYLGVKPGAVSAVGVLNDSDKKVEFFIDDRIINEEVVFIHPYRSDRTLGINGQDLINFISKHHGQPNFFNFALVERQ